MLAKTLSFGLNGLNGYPVGVEVDAHNGLPAFEIVGLADTAVKESRERVRLAIKNSGFEYPMGKVVVNLAPADTKKEGSVYDLAIAVGILCVTEQLLVQKAKSFVYLGELSLDGKLRKVNGILPALISAKQLGYTDIIIPCGNAPEAEYIEGLNIYTAESLRSVADLLDGKLALIPLSIKQWKPDLLIDSPYDTKYIKGQFFAKRALEIAVAGGHNMLMIGPPGSGKTMLAQAVPTIMPDLTFAEALEIAKISSVAGELDGFIFKRPFRSPHHTASLVSLTGGGAKARPGEISMAHNGVLFLDELPEYAKSLLETLRQPLEDKKITVARAFATVTYPANFMLIASMNPCQCGFYGSQLRECNCSVSQIQKYLSKLSGPLLDRIDINIEVESLSYSQLSDEQVSESSCEIKKRVDAARKIQIERFKDEGIFCNAQMNNALIKKYCKIDAKSKLLLENCFIKLKLTARAHNRILKVARTVADLAGSGDIMPNHIAEAIQYRSNDKFKV